MATLRTLLPAALFLLSGCDIDIKAKIGNSEKSAPHEKPWQVFATNKETRRIELWWSNHDSHDDCVKNVKFDLRSSVQAQWYTEPAGCMYIGSDNRYILYIMNKLYNANTFLCVAKMKNRADADREFVVVVNGAPVETDYYRCVLP